MMAYGFFISYNRDICAFAFRLDKSMGKMKPVTVNGEHTKSTNKNESNHITR